MSQYFSIHPTHPQRRLVAQAAAIVLGGGLIVLPTDSSYALGWRVGEKGPMERVQRLRQLGAMHFPTLVCRDLSELAVYARVENSAFRILRRHSPGPFTFILQATREVPRRLLNSKRKTVGLRVPDHAIVTALLDQLGEPLMSSSLVLPGDTLPMTDPLEMRERLKSHCDLIIDGGPGSVDFTTVMDLTEDVPRLIRDGLGQGHGLSLDDEESARPGNGTYA